jgi:hypothetical protein
MAAISMRSSADANVALTSIIILVVLSFLGPKGTNKQGKHQRK